MSTELILAPSFTPGDLIRQDGTLSLPDEWIERKNALLVEAAAVAPPATPHDRDVAISVAARIKGEMDDIEEARERDKAGYWKMCQAIDLTKKLHVKELDAERARINREVGAFNQAQADKAKREQEARDREAKRIADEAAAAQREADRQAEELRKEQEALALKQKRAQEAAEAKGKELTPEAKAKQLQAQLDAQEAQEKLEEASRQRQATLDAQKAQLEREQLEAAERQRQEKATGGAQRYDTKFTIPDLHRLYAANRGCVRLEPDLVQLKYIVNNQPDIAEKLTELAGVTWTKTPTFSPKGR